MGIRQRKHPLILRLDAHRARRDRALLRHPLGARTVEPAMAPAPVVHQPEHGKARRTTEAISADRVSAGRLILRPLDAFGKICRTTISQRSLALWWRPHINLNGSATSRKSPGVSVMWSTTRRFVLITLVLRQCPGLPLRMSLTFKLLSPIWRGPTALPGLS